MIKDFLISFKENFGEKVRNPFFGSYLLVWIIRNWILIYSLFNFNDDLSLNDRISYINKYFTENDFITNLLINILWTFGLLIVTYILLNLSRLIVNFSEKSIQPLVYKITDSKSIVLKSEFERIRNQRDSLQNKLDQERESKSKIEARYKKLEESILQKNNPFDNDFGGENKTNDTISKLINILKEQELLNEFTQTAIRIKDGQYIENSYKPLSVFKKLNLILYDGSSSTGSRRYKLTNDGENVFLESRLI